MVGIGFFAPFPLALMVPFMAGQSLAMGEAFGKGFQYGKRKISSMDNEEFNALDFKGLSESIATDYKVMIPSLNKSIEASTELQDKVFTALGKVILDIPPKVLAFLKGAGEQLGDFFQQSGGDGTPQLQNASLTSASQFGKLTLVRTNSPDREADKARTDAALAAGQQAFDDAWEFGSTTGLSSKNDAEIAAAEQLRLEKIAANTLRVQEEKVKIAIIKAANKARDLEIRTGQEQREFQEVLAKTGVVTSVVKRYAGPNSSALLERNKLIKEIAALGKTATKQRGDIAGCTGSGISSSTCSQWFQRTMVQIREKQAKLTIILQRYRFS